MSTHIGTHTQTHANSLSIIIHDFADIIYGAILQIQSNYAYV